MLPCLDELERLEWLGWFEWFEWLEWPERPERLERLEKLDSIESIVSPRIIDMVKSSSAIELITRDSLVVLLEASGHENFVWLESLESLQYMSISVCFDSLCITINQSQHLIYAARYNFLRIAFNLIDLRCDQSHPRSKASLQFLLLSVFVH